MKTGNTRRKWLVGITQITKEHMQEIYAEHDLETKRSMVQEIIDNFTFKTKAKKFSLSLEQASTQIEIDYMASNLYLCAKGLYV